LLAFSILTTVCHGEVQLPKPAQLVWQDCEIGLLYCFDLAIAAEVYSKNNTTRERFSKPVAALEGAEGDTITLDLPRIRSFACFMIGE